MNYARSPPRCHLVLPNKFKRVKTMYVIIEYDNECVSQSYAGFWPADLNWFIATEFCKLIKI